LASLKSVVVDCQNEINKGNYVDSYAFFSLNLKENVSLEGMCQTFTIIPNLKGMILDMKVGKTIRRLRRQKLMTLKDMYEVTGIQIATLSRMEKRY